MMLSYLEVFGKILINQFHVGIHLNFLRWKNCDRLGYFFDHSYYSDLTQCSYDISICLKLVNIGGEIPDIISEFD
jgi:hypothetical protein